MSDVMCLHRQRELALSGRSNNVGWWCHDCEDWVTPGRYLPRDHADLRGIDRSTLIRVSREGPVVCAICRHETHGAEWHHWCPQALYRDAGTAMADDGPGDYVCPPCHRQWHQLVTPMLGGTMTEARARQLLLTWYRKWSPAEWDAFVRATLSADEKVQHRRPRGRAA